MRAAFAPIVPHLFCAARTAPARSSATRRLSRRTRISATTCYSTNSFMAIRATVSARRTRPAGLRSQGIKSGHQGSFRPDQGIPYLHLGLAARRRFQRRGPPHANAGLSRSGVSGARRRRTPVVAITPMCSPERRCSIQARRRGASRQTGP